MEIEPVTGTPVRFPPGRVEIHLDRSHQAAYKSLYARYRTFVDGMPVLRERDFDGRRVRVTPEQLSALNRAFASLLPPATTGAGGAFDNQEQTKNRTSKKLQYLS